MFSLHFLDNYRYLNICSPSEKIFTITLLEGCANWGSGNFGPCTYHNPFITLGSFVVKEGKSC